MSASHLLTGNSEAPHLVHFNDDETLSPCELGPVVAMIGHRSEDYSDNVRLGHYVVVAKPRIDLELVGREIQNRN